MQINPVEKGHIAFRTDNLDEFLKILKEHGIPFLTMEQLCQRMASSFFHDPEGNVVEVHQKVD